MKTLLLLSLSLAAEPTMKERLQSIRIHELEMQVAAGKYDSAARAQQDAVKEHAAAKVSMEAARLDACKSVGGAKADDCDFTAESVKKKEVKK